MKPALADWLDDFDAALAAAGLRLDFARAPQRIVTHVTTLFREEVTEAEAADHLRRVFPEVLDAMATPANAPVAALAANGGLS